MGSYPCAMNGRCEKDPSGDVFPTAGKDARNSVIGLNHTYIINPALLVKPEIAQEKESVCCEIELN